MNKNGQLAGWEALIILVLLGGCAGLGYLYANKKTEANIYQNGSKPHVQDFNMSPFTCVREEEERGWTNAIITNKSSR